MSDEDTYIDTTFDPDTKHIVFDDDITDSIEPGSLDYLTQLESIVWGSSMTDLIQPGVIPDRPLCLLLPLTYTHPIDDSNLPKQTLVYLRTTNVSLAPTDRSFYLWEPAATTITIPKLGFRPYSYISNTSSFPDYQHIFATELIPQTHLDTTPEPSIFKLLSSLSRKPDSDMNPTSPAPVSTPTSTPTPMPKPVSIISMQLLQKLASISKSNAESKLGACAQYIASEILKQVQAASDAGTLHHGIEYAYTCASACNVRDLVNALGQHIPPSCLSATSTPEGSITITFSYKPR